MEFYYMQWNSGNTTYQPKKDKATWAADKVQEDLRKLYLAFPRLINRFHAARKLYLSLERNPGGSASVLPGSQQPQHGSPECLPDCGAAVPLGSGSSAWRQLRLEKLGRPALAQSLEKALEKL